MKRCHTKRTTNLGGASAAVKLHSTDVGLQGLLTSIPFKSVRLAGIVQLQYVTGVFCGNINGVSAFPCDDQPEAVVCSAICCSI